MKAEPEGVSALERLLIWSRLEDTLGRAHGYVVRDGWGDRVGRVARLDYGDPADGCPGAVVVRPLGWRGLASRRSCEVALEGVLQVDHGERQVLVRPQCVRARAEEPGGRPIGMP